LRFARYVTVDRAGVQRLEQLKSRLGPGTARARVAFEASREGWHVHDTLVSWGHEAKMVDTTRVRAMGVGHHKRKNDALDAKVAARAVRAAGMLLPSCTTENFVSKTRESVLDAATRTLIEPLMVVLTGIEKELVTC
jgi:hypothetical protein